jgi:predicted O-methyltransferase YrrM
MELENSIMLLPTEIEFLSQTVASLERDSIVLEVGTALGGSAEVMARANPAVRIFTMDLFGENGTDSNSVETLYNTVKTRLSKFSNITVLCGNAMTDFKDWSNEIDLYFEDGVHIDPALSTNLNRWISFLKPGGILLVHDNNEFCPDVEKNIQQLVKLNKFEIVKKVEPLIMLKNKE